MTAKEKAQELVSRYFKDYGEKLPDGTMVLCIVSIGRAKQCALICVEELMKHCERYIYGQGEKADSPEWRYWTEVKNEIESMN